MELKISCEFEHEGQTYKKGIVLDNLERVTEEEIKQSFSGELGKGFKMILQDAVRTLNEIECGRM